MTKKEWQTLHNMTDQEMEFICQMKEETGGSIVSVKPTPTLPNGSPVPFVDRK